MIKNDNLFHSVISYILMILGFSLWLYVLIFHRYAKEKVRDLIYLGGFCITFALWCFCETYTFDILGLSPYKIYLICYYSLFISPILFLLYMKNKVKNLNIITSLTLIHIIVIIALTLLQYFNIAEIVYTIRYFHILLFIEVIILCKYMFNRNTNVLKGIDSKLDYFISRYVLLVLFVVAVIVDVYRFYTGCEVQAVYTIIFIFIYLSLLVEDGILTIINEVALGKESVHLRKIAYKDPLTGINNRNVFVSKLKDLNISTSAFVSFDVNNLKFYNDNYGHDKGDLLLRSMSDTLVKVFGENAYRIGGDEYLAVLPNIEEKEVKRLLKEFDKEVEEFNKKNIIILQCAYGYVMGSKYNDLDVCLKEADKRMYANKKKIKKEKNILELLK